MKINLHKSIESLVLFAYSLIIFKCTIQATMLQLFFPNIVFTIINLLSLSILLFVSIFYNRYSYKEYIIIVLISFSVLMTFVLVGESILIILWIICVGLKGIPFKKVVKRFFFVSVSIVGSAFILSIIGLIENRVILRGDALRYSFGAIYPTDFAALVFFILLAYGYLKISTFNLRYLLIYMFIGGFIYKFCDARIDSFSIVLAGIVFYIFNHKKTKILFYTLKRVFPYALVIGSSIMIYLSVSFDATSSIYLLLDKFLSTRLRLGYRAFYLYPVTLFGTHVEMQGWGALEFDHRKGYFFLDSSYINILFRFGIVTLAIILIAYYIKTKSILRRSNYAIPVVIAIIAINCLFAHHLLDLAFNPFLFIFTTKIFDDEFSDSLNVANST